MGLPPAPIRPQVAYGLRTSSEAKHFDEYGYPPRRVASVSTLEKLRGVIAQVPRGKVITYGQVAAVAGYPHGARLTVWALHGGTDLPWQRVVAAQGRIALLGEEGVEQRLRLRLEGVAFRAGRVRMDLHGWSPSPQGGQGFPRRGRVRNKPRRDTDPPKPSSE